MSGFTWGGSEELWSATARAAVADRIQVKALVGITDLTASTQISSLNNAGISVQHHHLPIEPRPSRWNGLKRRLMVGTGRHQMTTPEMVREFAPDALLVSLASFGCLLNNTLLAAWLASCGVPYVLLVQFVPEDPEIQYLGVGRKVRSCLEAASRIAFVSQRNCENVRFWTGLDLHQSVIVRNPVNLSAVDPILPEANDTACFGHVARLDIPYKSQDLLIRGFAQEHWRRREFKLTLYGTGPHREAIQRMICRAGLEGKIVLAGHADCIATVWKNNEVALMPSRAEGTPLSLVEAMVSGRPAVVTDVGGMCEWVTDGEEGMVAEGANLASWTAAMERMWDERANWTKMGQLARARALRQMDQQPGTTMLNLLREIATEPRV